MIRDPKRWLFLATYINFLFTQQLVATKNNPVLVAAKNLVTFGTRMHNMHNKIEDPLFCYFIRAHSSSLVCCHLKAIEKPLTGRTVRAAVQQHTSVLEECGCKCTPIKSFYSWGCGIRSGVNQLCYNSTCSSHGSRRTEVYLNSSSRVRMTWKPLQDPGTEPPLNNVFWGVLDTWGRALNNAFSGHDSCSRRECWSL